MGGTFDPIHYGHLVTAEEARVQFGLAQVLFVPNHYPPHKALDGVTPPEPRYHMTLLATVTNPYFAVSRIEIDRPGPSYSIDTILELRRAHQAGTSSISPAPMPFCKSSAAPGSARQSY